MSKIRVLSDQLANQIAAGEVVERPASVAKELVENAIDAHATRIAVDIEGGGRRMLRVADDGEGMTRDDAVLAFERHATSKISSADDLAAISTLGFRGEALASIAAVARVELITKTVAETAATRVLIEGGRMRDVKDAAHPGGTTLAVRDLFFNVPARRKFLRSEATESYHLTNLVTHYALAHPEISFSLTNNGRETLRAAPARDLRERAYQIFGQQFLDNLLEVNGGLEHLARVRGFVSAPRERRTSRDAQYLFINGRFVRDRLVGRSLTEGYRSVLPHGVYPAALLFLEVPLEEVDVNVHPAKTEVRFRRAAAVSDAVRESVRATLASAGFVGRESHTSPPAYQQPTWVAGVGSNPEGNVAYPPVNDEPRILEPVRDFDQRESDFGTANFDAGTVNTMQPHPGSQAAIEFGFEGPDDEDLLKDRVRLDAPETLARHSDVAAWGSGSTLRELPMELDRFTESQQASPGHVAEGRGPIPNLPPLNSAAPLVRDVALEAISSNIRPLGQLEESFIIATDDEGLLLIDQHVAHERILFDKYRNIEGGRAPESQNLLLPETFDLTPAQAAVYDSVAEELESYGFGLMRLSGRTVAIKAVPADLAAADARNMLVEVLDTIDLEKRGRTRELLRDEIAASLACRAAIKINMPLTQEKMRWLIDRLLMTSSPTTCPHGRPVILRLSMRDIEKGFHRPQKPHAREA
jgi:DNA mismatch repair protein MutL